MDKEKFYIDMPDEITIQNEIKVILNKGLKPKETFYSYIKNMYKQIGINHLFHDAIEIVFTIVLLACIFVAIIFGSQVESYIKINKIYVFIMTMSPILYLALSLISFINTKYKGTYEIEMVCKYNLYQLVVLRMFVFSIICTLFNTFIIKIIVFKYNQINFIRAYMISITSLFLFSFLFLYLIFIIRSKITKYLVVIGWITLNVSLFVSNVSFYINLLLSLPIIIYVAITVVCIYFYIKKLKQIIKFTSIKGVI